MAPTLAPGKVCYLQIPALDVEASAAFYASVFGWRIRRDGQRVAFDDTVGEVSGSWTTSMPPGPLPYVLVDDVPATLAAVEAAGGSVVEQASGTPPEQLGRFADPAGNVVGVASQRPVRPTLVMPQLAVRDGRAAVAFYQEAFGAVVDHQVGGTDAHPELVAQLSVDGAPFWVADESPDHGSTSPERLGGASARMLLVVDDPDAAVARAVAAGATCPAPVADAHGWRLGRVVDPFGHHWEIGRPTVPWPLR
jgi:PhnB protein